MAAGCGDGVHYVMKMGHDHETQVYFLVYKWRDEVH